jgi:hypothetical protein
MGPPFNKYYSDFSSRIIDAAGSELALNQSSLSEFSGSLMDFGEILFGCVFCCMLGKNLTYHCQRSMATYPIHKVLVRIVLLL